MRAILPGILALFAAATVASAGSHDVVIECSQLLPGSTKGVAALEEQCPGLKQALEELGVPALLAPTSALQLQARQLPELLALIGNATPAPRQSPDLRTLGPILAALADQKAPKSWWDRLKEWVLARLANSSGQRMPGWLGVWLSKLGFAAPLLQFAAYVLLVLLLAGGCLLLLARLRPLRALHLPGIRRDRPARFRNPPPNVVLSLERIHAAPVQEQVGLLLRLLVDTLVGAGRLPDDRSLTHRELAQRARLEDEAQRARWVRLSACAERQLFARERIPSQQFGAILSEGEALYAMLRAAAGSAG